MNLNHYIFLKSFDQSIVSPIIRITDIERLGVDTVEGATPAADLAGEQWKLKPVDAERATVIDSSTIDAGNAAVPALGFGTARMTGEECRRAVTAALEAGYRHVDTAQLYDNEDAVGDALEASDVPREDVFVVTKLDTDNLAREDVLESTRRSCERLGLETIDLLLIHAPRDHTPLEETLGAMNELQEGGRVDHVGVSNSSAPGSYRKRRSSPTR